MVLNGGCLVKGAVQTYINKHCRSELIGELEEKKAELLQGMALQFSVSRNTHYDHILPFLKCKENGMTLV